MQSQFPDWWIRAGGSPYPAGVQASLLNELEGMSANASLSALIIRDQQHALNLSGGKDSCYLLYKLKREYGLNVAAFTADMNVPDAAWSCFGAPFAFGVPLVVTGHGLWATAAPASVIEIGHVPTADLPALYGAATLVGYASRYEGFGLPPLEAMSSGTPVVASAVSSLPEVVGGAAMLVNPENVFDIARGIVEVLTNQELRETLIEKGRKQAAKFSWARTAREVSDLYGEVAAAKRSKSGRR